MKRLLAAFAAALLCATPALADPFGAVSPGTAGTQSSLMGCYRPSSTPAPAVGQQMAVSCDANGNLVTVTGTGTSAQQVQGNVAGGATDAGNPVKTGGVFNSSAPTYTNGQRTDTQVDSKGNLYVDICNAGASNVCTTVGTASSDGQSSNNAGVTTTSRDFIYNGSSFDRAFTCTSTAAVNVTAAATTQIVALVSSQSVRVCSVMLSMSAAGTMKFVQGTGSNCGTGTADINTAMTLATGTPVAFSASSGGSILRTSASNALCIAAVTGNVTGMITYAQF